MIEIIRKIFKTPLKKETAIIFLTVVYSSLVLFVISNIFKEPSLENLSGGFAFFLIMTFLLNYLLHKIEK